MKYKNIIILTSDLYRGGVSYSSGRLAELLAKKGATVEIVTYENLPIRQNVENVKRVTSLNCPYSRTSHRSKLKQAYVRTFRFPAILLAARRFARFVKSTFPTMGQADKPTVIAFTHAPVAAAVLSRYLFKADFHLIASERQDPKADLKSRALIKILATLYNNVDKVHVNSPGLVERLEQDVGVPRSSIALIPNIVQRATESTLSQTANGLRRAAEEKTINAVVIGRISPQKAIWQAPIILAELKSRGFKVKLTVIGDGDPQPLEDLESSAAEHGIEDNIEIVGSIEDAKSTLHKYNLGLFLTNWESFGNVLGEFLAAGIITVASDTQAGLVNYLEDGIHCIKAPVLERSDSNSAKTLSEVSSRLATIYSDINAANTMRRHAISKMIEFDQNSHALRFIEEIERIGGEK